MKTCRVEMSHFVIFNFLTGDAFWGKIAIIVFTVIGTVSFLVLQCNWYRKFFHKLARVNREIKLEIEEKDKCFMRNFSIQKSLSTIRELNYLMYATWASR